MAVPLIFLIVPVTVCGPTVVAVHTRPVQLITSAVASAVTDPPTSIRRIRARPATPDGSRWPRRNPKHPAKYRAKYCDDESS